MGRPKPKLGELLLGRPVRPGWGLPMGLADIRAEAAKRRARMVKVVRRMVG